MKWVYYLLLLVCVDSQYHVNTKKSYNPCIDKNHIFLAPGVLSAGGSNRACISRFYTEGPARLVLTLLTEDRQTVTATRDLPPGDGGCIDISVPMLPNSKADLMVNLIYPEAQCIWERRVSVRIASGLVIAVHTERARYRPGDTVRVRLFVLKADLTPAPPHTVIEEIWLEGPRGAWEGARAARWMHTRTRLGVAQVQHDLDDMAPTGQWTLRARGADGSQGSAVFWVGNYELPPFQLSVRHAPRVLRSSERLVWTVCVRYPWTEAVEGMLVIRIRSAGTPTSDGTGIRTAVRLKAPRACHRHAAAAKRIGLDAVNPPYVVVADFSFQEDGTRIWQNTTVVSQVVEKPVTLEFLRKNRAVISPGLPYKLKVKATRWDDKPAANELVRVCRTPASQTSFLTQDQDPPPKFKKEACSEAVTDVMGIARVVFSADDDGSPFNRFQATLKNDTTVTTTPLYLPIQRGKSLHAALGALKVEHIAARSLVPLYLNIRNFTKALTIHFVVITRGGIIYRWGATTQCPFTNSVDLIQTAARNSTCYANIGILDINTNNPNVKEIIENAARINVNPYDAGKFDVNASDSLIDRHMLRVMLPIKVTHQMCPDSHLVAYFYHNGELISASKHFEMEECFGNKVEATWLSRQTPPGSSISLHLSTLGPAFCALTALDTAAKWVQPAPTIKDVLMERLRRLIESHRNLTEYDAAGECFLTADTPDLPTTNMELTVTWLAAAGVRMLGGDAITTRRCHTTAPAPLLADEATAPRSDFSEAWLWRLISVGYNGTVDVTAQAPDSITRYEASAVCISRTGVSISPPAVLQVFREFFIHADGPNKLKRGDTTTIQYRLFNYLYEPLSVQIQILTDEHLGGPSSNIEAACIDARSSIVRRVEIRAQQAGNTRISIRAKSVKNGSCGNATRSKSEVSDEVIIEIVVEPEGIPVKDQRSILLCEPGSAESSISEVTWTWPKVKTIPGTETLYFWATGNITGPLLADADDLVMLPRGCGEQNMARLATNLLALKQLEPHSAAALIAKQHVARGFTRQLQYMHPSGGFSAFGAADGIPSTWLTAFTVKYLRRAHQVLTPDLPAPPAISRSEQWLLNQQMENGCFRNEGQVFHRELRGALNEDGEIASVALTAYVITALMESTTLIPSRILHNTLSCLRALPPLKTGNPTKVYAHSLLAYAFSRIKNYEETVKGLNEASLLEKQGENKGALEQHEELKELVELLKLAKRRNEYIWWETGSLSTSIEATSYALLALSGCPKELRETSCVHDARGAIRWLSTHRNAAGGFLSTQDTLVALEALTAWSTVHPTSPSKISVTVQTHNMTKVISVQPGETIPEVAKLGDGTKLNVKVKGTGCALVQATRSYNTYSSANDTLDKKLLVQVSVHTDGPFNCDVNGSSCFCAAVIEACVIWTGTFPEMALLEVALPGGFGADAALLYSQLQHANTLLRRIELTPKTDRATLYLGTRDGSDMLGRGGHQCYSLHAVGPKAKTKPAYAKVLDYYRPVVNDTQMYTIPETCPPRISYETNHYRASENLFGKAKALSNSAEVEFENEFNFKVPEAPLEDPLYDRMIPLAQQMITNATLASKNRANLRTNTITNNVINKTINNVTNATSYYVTNTISDNVASTKIDNKMFNIDDKMFKIDDDTKHMDDSDFVIIEEQRANNTKQIADNNTKQIFDNNTKQVVANNSIQIVASETNQIIANVTTIQPCIKKSEETKTVVLIANENNNVKNDKLIKETISNKISDKDIEKPKIGSAIFAEESYEARNEKPLILMPITNTVNEKQFTFKRKAKAKLNVFDQDEVFSDRPPSNSKNKVQKAKINENEQKIAEQIKETQGMIQPISEDDLYPGSVNKNEVKTDKKEEGTKDIDNPNLADFHVIDTDVDLEFPAGVEGPVPSIVLPPSNLKFRKNNVDVVQRGLLDPAGRNRLKDMHWPRVVYQNPRLLVLKFPTPQQYMPAYDEEDYWTTVRYKRFAPRS